MKPGDVLTTTRPIRSQKTGIVLPRQGTFVSAIENLGRQLILVDFDKFGPEYLFPNEIITPNPVLKTTSLFLIEGVFTAKARSKEFSMKNYPCRGEGDHQHRHNPLTCFRHSLVL